jgi:hypothetical protein
VVERVHRYRVSFHVVVDWLHVCIDGLTDWAHDFVSIMRGDRVYTLTPCTCSPRSSSSTSRYRLVPARRGITPRHAGTRLYQPAKELFLGKQVPTCNYSPRNSSSASWYKHVPARQRVLWAIVPLRAGTSMYQPAKEFFEQVSPRDTSLASWYKPVPARRGQRRRPPGKPRRQAFLPGFFVCFNARASQSIKASQCAN